MIQDAVVVVPGIAGSVLETEDRVLWGARWSTAAAAFHGDLAVTAQERQAVFAGKPVERVRATRLLEVPAWLPDFGAIGMYRTLLERLRCYVDPAALMTFPYDWRLPVAYNAPLLARAALTHLRQVRADVNRNARLIVVAHSMGGLVTREACFVSPEFLGSTDKVVTLGTPFRGAAKAALILGGTLSANPIRRRVGRLVASMPGVYDLLPVYPSVATATGARTLDPGDITSFGGAKELAEASRDFHRPRGEIGLPGHRLIVGAGQRTPTNLDLTGRTVTADDTAFRYLPNGEAATLTDGRPERQTGRSGDGTVPRYSADLGTAIPIGQRHSGLPGKAAVQLEHVLTEQPGNPYLLGPDEAPGLDVPDLAAHGTPWQILLTGETRAHYATIRSLTGGPTRETTLGKTTDPLGLTTAFSADAPRNLPPGLYEVTAGELSEHVYVTAPEDTSY